MPSRSGIGRGTPTEREKRTIASCSPGFVSSATPRGAAGSPVIRSRPEYTTPWGWTALPRRAAASAASTPPTVVPIASAAKAIRGPYPGVAELGGELLEHPARAELAL